MGKTLTVSQLTHLRCFPIAKIECQLNLHFLATGRFCRPSLEVVSEIWFAAVRDLQDANSLHCPLQSLYIVLGGLEHRTTVEWKGSLEHESPNQNC